MSGSSGPPTTSGDLFLNTSTDVQILTDIQASIAVKTIKFVKGWAGPGVSDIHLHEEAEPKDFSASQRSP